MSPPPATLSSLQSLFPLTSPIPNPLTHPEILHPDSLTTEEDLLLNPENFKTWFTHIAATKERLSIAEKAELVVEEENEDEENKSASVLGPLRSARSSLPPSFFALIQPSSGPPKARPAARTDAICSSPTSCPVYRTSAARLALQTLTSLYERALAVFPTSFKLWKSYILMRQRYILGPSVLSGQKKRVKSNLQKLDVGDLLEENRVATDWEGGLDGIVGYEEWRSLFATTERMISWLPNVSTCLRWVRGIGELDRRR